MDSSLRVKIRIKVRGNCCMKAMSQRMLGRAWPRDDAVPETCA